MTEAVVNPCLSLSLFPSSLVRSKIRCAAGYVGECNRMRRSRQSRIVARRACRVTEVAGLGVIKDGSEAVLK